MLTLPCLMIASFTFLHSCDLLCGSGLYVCLIVDNCYTLSLVTKVAGINTFPLYAQHRNAYFHTDMFTKSDLEPFQYKMNI